MTESRSAQSQANPSANPAPPPAPARPVDLLFRAVAFGGLLLWIVVFGFLWQASPVSVRVVSLLWAAVGLAWPRIYLLTLALAFPFFGNNPGGALIENAAGRLDALYLIDMGLMGFAARDALERLIGRRRVRPMAINGLVRLFVLLTAMALIPQHRYFYAEAATFGADFLHRIYTHYATAPVFGLRVFLDLLLAATLFAALRDAPPPASFRRLLWAALLAGLSAAAAIGLLNYFGLLSLAFWRGENPDIMQFGYRRLQSLFWHSGWFAQYLAALAPAALAFALAPGVEAAADPIGERGILRRRLRPAGGLWLAAAALLGLTQLLTFQRGGWLALTAGFGVAAGVVLLQSPGETRRRMLRATALAAGAAAAAVAVLALLIPALARRIQAIARVRDRSRIWDAAWEIATEQPWIGCGAGNYYSRHIARFGFRHEYYNMDKVTAHNTYLHIFAERGLPAALVFAAIVAATLWVLWRAARRRSAGGTDVLRLPGEALALLGAMSALAVYAVFQHLFYMRVVELIFWMHLGLAFGVAGAGAAWPSRPVRRRWARALGVVASLCLLAFLGERASFHFWPPHLFGYDHRNYWVGKQVVELELPEGADRVIVPLHCFNPSAKDDPVVYTLEMGGETLAEVSLGYAEFTEVEVDLPDDRSPETPLTVRASRTWRPYPYVNARMPILEMGMGYRKPVAAEEDAAGEGAEEGEP